MGKLLRTEKLFKDEIMLVQNISKPPPSVFEETTFRDFETAQNETNTAFLRVLKYSPIRYWRNALLQSKRAFSTPSCLVNFRPGKRKRNNRGFNYERSSPYKHEKIRGRERENYRTKAGVGRSSDRAKKKAKVVCTRTLESRAFIAAAPAVAAAAAAAVAANTPMAFSPATPSIYEVSMKSGDCSIACPAKLRYFEMAVVSGLRRKASLNSPIGNIITINQNNILFES
ncbi:hypothetical protein V1477_018691 [Vespula maculifrons]|uniref:Uncharacterized protein n=1 Tax=Vespula maculifrons TaxID=7453 RepID=A0ABD2AWI0_VESMC